MWQKKRAVETPSERLKQESGKYGQKEIYKENVVICNKTKYSKASNELLDQVFCTPHSYISNDGKQWICQACDNALSLQVKANNLQLDEIPIELSTLNALEPRLISLRVPFMKMVALPSGKGIFKVQL